MNEEQKAKLLDLILDQFDEIHRGNSPYVSSDMNNITVDLYGSGREIIGRIPLVRLLSDIRTGVYDYNETDESVEGGCDLHDVEWVEFVSH